MNIYINIAWIAVGLIILAYGVIVFKKRKFNWIKWFGKSKVTDKDNFSDFYGKSINFLGICTAVSSLICINDRKYLLVSIILQIIAVIYFILESFHLVKLYSRKEEKE